MPAPILATKLYLPPPRQRAVLRTHLTEKLNAGLHGKLTIVSAPAGFGKTTLISGWVAIIQRPVAWFSLDDGDNDPNRFFAYFVTALQTIAPAVGHGVIKALQSTQPPPLETLLTTLLNEIATLSHDFLLVLDDYHVIKAEPIDQALTFLIEHLPPQMHLVITTREVPDFPLARWRVRGQLTELRAADVRFTSSETAAFLNQVMGLNLSAAEIAMLDTRTEGWVAGLQLAALALQGSHLASQNATNLIESFTGSHHLVLDYLVEEVVQQQPEQVQTFLLHTAILDRLCGPLCDALLTDSATAGQKTLEYLEQANLFLIPLDNERRWYRYHHLFADLLRQRLRQSYSDAEAIIVTLHQRASQWCEDNGLELEAFHHATAANDLPRAQRLIEGNGMPLHFRGALMPVLNWLQSLPPSALEANPALQVMYANVLTMAGQPISGIEKMLQKTEEVLHAAEPTGKNQDLLGQIAAIRAMLAIPVNKVDEIMTQSQRALDYLHPDNLPVRASATWTLGLAYQLRGKRSAAIQTYNEAITTSQATGNVIFTLAATTCLGQIQESENQLYQAAESYRYGLQLAGDPPLPAATETYFGLARILYQWNELEAAEQHAIQSLQLAPQLKTVGTVAAGKAFLARLKLAQGDTHQAAVLLTEAEQFIRERPFLPEVPQLTTVWVLLLLQQGDLSTAAQLAHTHQLPLSQARVHLARGNPAAAAAVLETAYQQALSHGLIDERLQVQILQAVVYASLDPHKASPVLMEALTLAEPGGFMRLFVDEGRPIYELLQKLSPTNGRLATYIHKLLATFDEQGIDPLTSIHTPLLEPLSERELEVLQLVAEGLSNREISERLFLALDTVKGHNRRIYAKLQVQRRTEAVARGRELGLLEQSPSPKQHP